MNSISDLATVDPQWAWDLFRPASDHPWTRRDVAHLYRRAGLAAGSFELEAGVRQTPEEVVDSLFQSSLTQASDQSVVDELARASLATGDCRNLAAWWTYVLLNTSRQLLEKTTLFWHSHFATSAAKVADPHLMHRQNQLLRTYALGDFGELLHRISRDPAMLIYLDSATNRKAHANENYAREIMELFYLGEGNYSEQDIRELARCFTGWEIRRREFRFNRFQHDPGRKTILSQAGEFDGDDGVAIVLKQQAGPMFLVRKLVRFFVFDEPDPPNSLIEPLAVQLRNENLNIGPVIKRILSSNLFFDPAVRGRKVRSPVEFLLGWMRCFHASTNTYRLAQGLGELGQDLFYPPNVKGWDGGRTWINSSTLLSRANVLRELLTSRETRFAGESLADLLDKEQVHDAPAIVNWLSERFLAIDLAPATRNRIEQEIDHGPGDREQRLRNSIHLLGTLPEAQLA